MSAVTAPPAVTLALDAATYEGSVAVIRGGRVVAERTVVMRGETEERLMPAVLAALAEAGHSVRDVEHVVCGEGPGRFTSLRIAGAIAKGIAFGNAIPLYAVSSLALVVAGALDIRPGAYLAVLDAMRGERFVAPFTRAADGSLTVLGLAARVTHEAAVEAALRDGAIMIGPLEPHTAMPHARGVAPLLDSIVRSGAVSVDAWEPFYGRLAEAQVKWEAAHGRSLPA